MSIDDLPNKLEDLRKRKEAAKSVIEQAKGRAAELDRRIEEQRKLLRDIGVTPETASEVLDFLKHEIIYKTNLIERLLEEVENGIEQYKQGEQNTTV